MAHNETEQPRSVRIPSMYQAVLEDSHRLMKRIIVGLAATVLISGGLAVVDFGLVGTAQAFPTAHVWCPGDPLPNTTAPIDWNMTSCHHWDYGMSYEPGDVTQLPPPAGQCLGPQTQFILMPC